MSDHYLISGRVILRRGSCMADVLLRQKTRIFTKTAQKLMHTTAHVPQSNSDVRFFSPKRSC